MDELGIESYTFSDMLLLREVCIVVSRRSANLAAACKLSFLQIKPTAVTFQIDINNLKTNPIEKKNVGFSHRVCSKQCEKTTNGGFDRRQHLQISSIL